jgi:hypothetical protein
MASKLIFGILSIVPALFAYTFYFRDMLAGKTKPHTFSWLIWGILAGNGFIAQVGANAGIGSWATGMTSAACLTIFFFALFKGDTKLVLLDWTLLGLAVIAFSLLFVVHNPTASLCITLFATLLGFTMTLRKAYLHPLEENARAFFLNAIKFLPSIFALSSFSFLTAAYPLTAMTANASVVLVIYARKLQSI